MEFTFKGYQHPENTKDPYFTAALLTYQGEALAYLGRDMEAIDTLQQAIKLLEPIRAEDDYWSWTKAHVLGRAHNNLGYVYSRERRSTDAVTEYEKALEYFGKAGITSLEADTLKNKAMSLARQGKLLLAREFAIDAEQLFRKLSMHYGEALTLNTRGLIELQREEPQDAEPLCRRALQIFTDLDDARGVGLASIGLGWALRKKGAFVPFYSEEVENIFGEAEKLLKEAIDIFKEKVEEPARLIEAYAQLGLKYRDQANLYRDEDVRQPDEISGLEEQAKQYLTTSIELAKQRNLQIEQADCLEDLAEIHSNRGEYDRSKELLEQSDQLIPIEYQIARERGIPSPERADPNLWLILGKNNVLRGYMAFAQHEYEKMMEAYLLSKNYFELYSVGAMERDVRTGASRRMLKQLRGLPRETLEDLWQYTQRVAEEYRVTTTLGTERTFRILDLALQAVGPGGQAEKRGGE